MMSGGKRKREDIFPRGDAENTEGSKDEDEGVLDEPGSGGGVLVLECEERFSRP